MAVVAGEYHDSIVQELLLDEILEEDLQVEIDPEEPLEIVVTHFVHFHDAERGISGRAVMHVQELLEPIQREHVQQLVEIARLGIRIAGVLVVGHGLVQREPIGTQVIVRGRLTEAILQIVECTLAPFFAEERGVIEVREVLGDKRMIVERAGIVNDFFHLISPFRSGIDFGLRLKKLVSPVGRVRFLQFGSRSAEEHWNDVLEGAIADDRMTSKGE